MLQNVGFHWLHLQDLQSVGLFESQTKQHSELLFCNAVLISECPVLESELKFTSSIGMNRRRPATGLLKGRGSDKTHMRQEQETD